MNLTLENVSPVSVTALTFIGETVWTHTVCLKFLNLIGLGNFEKEIISIIFPTHNDLDCQFDFCIYKTNICRNTAIEDGVARCREYAPFFKRRQ